MKRVILILQFLTTTFLFAQEKAFVREYTYQASEIDSKLSSRAISINQLRVILLNEIGIYVESENLLKTSDINGKFNQDFVETISTISAGITKLVILDEKWDGKTYWIKASITVDKKELELSLKQVINDRQRINELEELREKLEKAKRELISLTNELKDNKGEGDSNYIEKYNREVSILSAADFIYSGLSKLSGDFVGAIADFTEAIKIDPLNENTYFNRGLAKVSIQDYRGAIKDYTKAIELDPNNSMFYLFRGMAKCVTPRPGGEPPDHLGAIEDYSKTIELEPDILMAMLMRGLSYSEIDKHYEAIIDYNKLIQINRNNAEYFYYRAISKAGLNDFRGAIADFNTSLKLEPKRLDALVGRGAAKLSIQDYRGAIIDLNKVIELDPNNSLAYINRGLSRLYSNQKDKGCQDLSKAGELGLSDAYNLINKYCN